MAQKQKYYVVWTGRKPGIYKSWFACEAQVKGFAGARYKSFSTEAEAKAALQTAPAPIRRKSVARKPTASTGNLPPNPPDNRHDTVLPLPLEVVADAIAVDAACSGNPGPMEYRGVYLKTGQEIFHFGPVRGTNNIGEFLAIVHGLALLKQKNMENVTLYSDSRNALLWVKKKKCNTKLARTPKTEELFQMIERAETWLQQNKYTTPLVKWETSRWGEVPADFGRK